MFSICADGTFLAPMVVYTAQSCYSEWTTGGPVGTVYDATQSGWLDSRCFHRWFSEILPPHAQTLQGPKAVIGDNLAAHFTEAVVTAAVDNDIRFVCLLPNATHLLQPLDVAVFRGLKIEWRQILEIWRKEFRLKGSIPKNQFPTLLARLHARQKPENAIAGFRATGLCPLDKESVLKRMPQSNKDKGGEQQVKATFNAAIATMLEKHCSPDSGKKVVRTRGKKIIPGKPILDEDLTPSTSRQSTSKVHAKAAKKTVEVEPESSEESISESDNAAESESNDDNAANSEVTVTVTRI